MDNNELIAQLKYLIENFLKNKDFILIDLIYRYEGGDLFLRILTDHPKGGINLDVCASLNRQIGDLIEEANVFKDRFILEVSSPGLDRPLRTKTDFFRSQDKRVRFFLNTLINGKLEWEGIIKDVNDSAVYVDVEGETLEIPLFNINKAKPVL